MPEMKDKDYLSGKQYADSSRLSARARIHEYNTNPHPWNLWLFDHFKLPEQCRILELGCGTGYIWIRNADRIPSGWDITLTDLSPGMLDEARRNLEKLDHRFTFGVTDAMSIPFDPASYDAVVANHMLYHIPDLSQALSEINRVLRPGGQLYASTIGNDHMIELHRLASRYVSGDEDEGKKVAASFGLQTGREKLERFFDQVELFIYEDSLKIPEAQPVIDYILSLDVTGGSSSGKLEELRNALQEMILRDSSINITKETGLFVASVPQPRA